MYKAHLFICTNGPDKEHKCGGKHAEDLVQPLKEHFKRTHGKEVRVSKSGCLGQCENGIACVVYPQNKWLLNLKRDDSQKLIQAVEDALKGK